MTIAPNSAIAKLREYPDWVAWQFEHRPVHHRPTTRRGYHRTKRWAHRRVMEGIRRMNREEALDLLLEHFQANSKAHLLMPRPHGEEKKTVHQALSRNKLKAHLRGEVRIGFFCFADGDRVKWGVFDIDSGDRQDLQAICRVLDGSNVPHHIETSKSKGWHVWTFYDLVPAWKVRRMLLWVRSEAGVTCEVVSQAERAFCDRQRRFPPSVRIVVQTTQWTDPVCRA